jgi:hypothetical protein
MVIVLIAISTIATLVTRNTPFITPALINLVGSFWSNGVMANFRNDPQGAPNWAAGVSMITTLGAIVLIVIGLVAGHG